jgi:RNA polymerase sigma factor (sigma-70 family)
LQFGQLVRAAADGDRDAWDSLVDRLGGLIWSITRAYELEAAEAGDVVQTTWLRLVEQLDRIRDPDRVTAWIATTTRRECLAVIRSRRRQVPVPEAWLEAEAGATATDVAAPLLTAERDTMLWRAFETLPERCRSLLRVLTADPAPAYEDVAAALDMPVGSIGPTRARCLEQLRRRIESISADLSTSF